MLVKSTLLSLLAATASAADFSVKVGANGNTFEPATIQASVGDTVSFHFSSSRHSVVESTFDAPCTPLSGGFHVGPQSDGSAVFTVNVTSTDPMWFYCSVSSHCQGGMVGVINAPTGKTQSNFASKAAGASSGSTPSGVQGGVLVAGGSTSTGAAASATGGSASSASASSASSASSKAGGVKALATAAPAALALVVGGVAAML